ncbi:MAG TPA: tetratricopeptide repeat protein [Thermodesulfovibrionales bacterium]|nr:tetratricopeptide repeat protein [Thermodesulfovibrionales bacterium]
MEEIEKLRIRVEKDPNSRLFLPLAEEYRKMGMLDEAISVILSGLERQPGYTSARVALGRIYLEKNMIEEARNEFEKVVSVIPDNLFSHKKLAEIYREHGETLKAVDEYRKVIQLNPLDDDAKISLEEIEGRPHGQEETVYPLESPGEPVPEAEGIEALSPELHTLEEETVNDPQNTSHEEFEKFKDSLSGEPPETIGEIEDFAEISEDEALDLSEALAFDDVIAEPEVPPQHTSRSVPHMEEQVKPAGSAVDIASADSMVASGNFFKALEIYREVLSQNPDDKQTLQRIMELKALMKLMGKGEEMVIAKLEAFLSGVKKNFGKSQ